MLTTKIEQAKKQLNNLYIDQQITAEEYRQAIDQLDNRKDYSKAEIITKNDLVAPRVPEVDPTQYQDIDYFEDGVLIPADLYESNRFKVVDGKEKHVFTSKAMYSVFFLLCKHSRYNKVVGLTTGDMARELGYKDSRNLRNAIDKLEEEGIISVDRRVKPYIYELASHKGKRYFAVPERLMKQVKSMKLKQLRLQWTYMARNLLSPRNTSKGKLSLGHLRKMVNADCYKEVMELASSLKDRFFSKIKEIKGHYWRSYNKLKVSFNNKAIGIIEDVQSKLENYKSHHLYKSIKDIFTSLEIKLSSLNFRQAIDMMQEYTERELLIVKQNINNVDKSYSGSAGYLRHLLQRARNGALVVQY